MAVNPVGEAPMTMARETVVSSTTLTAVRLDGQASGNCYSRRPVLELSLERQENVTKSQKIVQ